MNVKYNFSHHKMQFTYHGTETMAMFQAIGLLSQPTDVLPHYRWSTKHEKADIKERARNNLILCNQRKEDACVALKMRA